MDATPLEMEFRGTERFRVVRRLGAGGMGVVYEVEDTKRGRRVALKTIKHADVELLYRLKREFRALADLSHPNLIELYDLVVEDGACFFTMELVRGRDFVAHCRRGVPGGGAGGLDEARLRAALPSLVEGLRALHAAGKVHRDIKPSNVLVTDEGRLVLLDFGLAADTSRASLDTLDVGFTGTAEYMAPEQASGSEPTSACDWYSVGALLFESLTGAVPFSGSLYSVLVEKNRADAPAARSLASDVPEDLDRLCADLLQRDPARRPGPGEILARLGAAGPATPLIPPPRAAPAAGFTGREREISALFRAFEPLASGRASVALVLGPSGIGKSALVREFLDRLAAARPDAVVLEGRCYERELVPFRAIDGLIDHLSHHWRGLPAAEAAALLPHAASSLPRLFPVLARVPCLADAPAPQAHLDPRELRARASRALREAFHRLAERHPLVLVLDDLQWVDPGTVTLLADLMRPPDPPPLMLVLSSRNEAAADLDRLAAEMGAEPHRVEVGPLPEAEATALAAALLGDVAPETARRIARETEGSPFFLAELARHVRESGVVDLGSLRLEQVLGERIGRLPARSRRLLEVVAVAGEPIDPPLAGQAASVGGDDLPREVGALRTGHLLRAAVGGGDVRLEPYHDRIKQCVLEAIPPEQRRERHGALAAALEAQGRPEQLARHWALAGEPLRAARHARVAADEALATHHFDHAADLYRTALDLGRAAGADRRDLLVRLGSALRNAGRCAESAEACLAAAEGADPAARLECRRQAAEDFLVSGHVPQGLEALAAVLAEIGEHLPATPRRALASVVWHRIRLRLRGLSFTPRDASKIPPRDLVRLDVTMAVALGLGMVDNIRGAVFQTRGLLLALKTGERRRVGRSLALEAIFRTSLGTKGRDGARPLIEATGRIAAESKDPYLRTWVELAESFSEYCGGDFPAATRRLQAVEAWIRSETTGTTWELNNARIFMLQAMRYRGDWSGLSPLFDEWLRDARRRGDRYAETTLVRALNGVWLARDDAAGAREALESSSWVLPEGTYHLQHWYELRARSELALYEGAEVSALLPEFERLEGSMLTRVQTVRTESRWLRGRLLLSGSGAASSAQLRDVRRLAALLDKDRASYAGVWARLLIAGAADLDGAAPSALGALREAAAKAETGHMPLCAAVARLREASTEGVNDGPALLARATAWLREHGIADPLRMARVVAPVRSS